MVSRRGAVRLVLVSAIAWAMLGLVALAFHLRPCSSPVAFLSGQPARSPTRRGFHRCYPYFRRPTAACFAFAMRKCHGLDDASVEQ